MARARNRALKIAFSKKKTALTTAEVVVVEAKVETTRVKVTTIVRSGAIAEETLMIKAREEFDGMGLWN